MSDSTEDVAFTSLDANQIDRLRPYGKVLEIPEGDLLFREGDKNLNLFVVLEGEFVFSRIHRSTEQDIELGTAAPGDFIGEYNVLTGEVTFVRARAAVRSEVLAVSEPALRELMAADNDLGDLLFAVLVARREVIIGSDLATTLTIVGSRHTSRTLDLVSYARRMRIAHRWVDPEDDPSLYDTLVSAVSRVPNCRQRSPPPQSCDDQQSRSSPDTSGCCTARRAYTSTMSSLLEPVPQASLLR